ncbi:hypothetical protein A5M85_03790 [Cellulophaga lytica]|uniref:hypothetical protein n=1 Tax=Cellulophaga lytica TaxID=979 RepID=UPI000950703C|nr:hypothetical protein [Cellulophaga lytica]APU09433.1 hypothetical protein A5M85_03790 [Cellulophaga lytica]
MSKKALQNAVRFRQPFTEKYTLTTKTNIQAGHFPVQTKTVIRWSLQVLNIDEKGKAEIELLTLEHLMVETNNPNLQDIASLNQIFGKMYSELHLIIDIQGKVNTILNLKHIQNKWKKTKEDLKKIQEKVPALQNLIDLNDDIFNSPEKIKLAIENNEFFKHYFHKIYGRPQPISGYSVEQLNLLQTAPTSWDYTFTKKPDHDFEHIKKITINYTGEASVDTAWKKKAYGHLQEVDTKKIEPKLTENGKYFFDAKTGRLLNSEIIIKEIADSNFIHGSMHFILQSDSHKFKNFN